MLADVLTVCEKPPPWLLGLIGLLMTKYAGAFHFVFLMQVLKRLVLATIKDVYEECLLALFVWVNESALPMMRLLVCKDNILT